MQHDHDAYFYSLVRPVEKKKKRSCPKCGVMRISQHRGDRICASCIGTQQSVGARAEYICKVPGLIERGRD